MHYSNNFAKNICQHPRVIIATGRHETTNGLRIRFSEYEKKSTQSLCVSKCQHSCSMKVAFIITYTNDIKLLK